MTTMGCSLSFVAPPSRRDEPYTRRCSPPMSAAQAADHVSDVQAISPRPTGTQPARITPQYIRAGRKNSIFLCPLVMAIRETVHPETTVWANHEMAVIKHLQSGGTRIYRLDAPVAGFVQSFDSSAPGQGRRHAQPMDLIIDHDNLTINQTQPRQDAQAQTHRDM